MNPGSPPSPSTATPRPAEKTGSRGAMAMALVAAAFAFILASTPVRQTEVWSHLARGRALAEGRPLPDRDPELLAPAGDHHAHSSRLYDLLLYGEFRTVGGTGVAILSAATAALLAVVLVFAGRSTHRSALGNACTLLALVCVAPWLGVTPRLFSFLFLALLVLLLRKSVESAALSAKRGTTRWLVPVLIAVWANVDRWVVLGPLAIGLLGMAEWQRGRSRSARRLAELFLTGMIASLLSPNFVTTWDPSHIIAGQPSGPTLSPFWPAWYRSGPVAVSVAFALLVLLGLVAFRRDSGGEVRIWVPLWFTVLGLAIVWPEAAPFFAVIAGPVAALGLSSVRWSLFPNEPVKRRWAAVAARRGASLIGVAALFVCAWPGWIAGPPYGRPSFTFDVDHSLRDAVEVVAKWRGNGFLESQERGLAFAPEVADYWSWFGSGPRLATHEPTRGFDFAAVQAGLLGAADAKTGSGADWRSALRAQGVDHLILHSGGSEPTERIVTRLAGAPNEWPLLYLRGRTAIFGWRDPSARGTENRFAAIRLRLERRAFLPSADWQAPLDGADLRPAEREWSQPFREPPHPHPEDQAEAALDLSYFDGHRDRNAMESRTTWLASQYGFLLGNLAAPAPDWAAIAAATGQMAIGVPGDWAAFLTTRDDGPIGALYLAVRAARRAIRANPEDAKSFFLLGEAYLRLAQATQERSWRRQLPIFDRIRRMQAIAAYQRALSLRPDSVAAHGRLARLYRDLGYLDWALHHLDGMIQATRQRGPQPGESPEVVQESLASLGRERDVLATETHRREDMSQTGNGIGRVLDQAREAVGLGLPGRALAILLKSDSSEFGPEGVRLELELLLWAGREKDVRAWLDPAMEKSLGAVTYFEIQTCLAAAAGNYRQADQAMSDVIHALAGVQSRLPSPHAQGAYDAARAILATPLVGINPGALTHSLLVREGLIEEIQLIATGFRREGNALVVAGLLALESGQIDESERLFREALSRWSGDARGTRAGWLDFSGRPVAQDGLRLITSCRAGG
jgi:tetratricopeptide (TPR) repeat protein